MLLLCILIAGSTCAWATTYKLEKVTSVEAGSMYVFEQDGHVMKNTLYSSSALQTTDTYNTTGLSGTETYVWCLESATGGFYMRNVSKDSKEYLNNTSSTTMSFGDKNSIWSFSFEDGVALIQNSSNENRFLGYASSPAYVYKAYTTDDNYLSICPHAITVYKLVEEVNVPSSSVSFIEKTPSIDYPGTTTYSQAPETATGYSDKTGASITYEITANTAGATIDVSSGEVTVAHEGCVTVKATAAAIEGKFTSSYDTYTLTVNDNRIEAPISFPVATAEAMMGEDFEEPVLTNDQGLTITYSSDNEAVATVNATSGAVTLVAVGTANIIATFAGDATYKYTTAQYELTVNKGAQALPYEESFNKTFGEFTTDGVEVNEIKVWNCVQSSDFAKATSSISGINHNAESWLTSPVIDATNVTHFALSFEQSIDSYFGTIANEAMVYAKNVGDTDWTKLSITYPTTPKEGYYSSFVTTTVDLSAFAGNKMQIAFVYIGTTSKAGAWLVKNVKFSESAVDITVTSDGWATYVTPYALRFGEGDAYIVNTTGDKVVYLESVTDVPTDTPVILKGEGTKTATVLTTADAITDNKLAISDGNVTSCYVLAKMANGVGFYKWTGGALSAGRVYLPADVVTSAHEFLGLTLGDETGVNEVRGRRSEGRGEVYDLQGRKVLKPTQGLYIVNGKRVAVK